MDLHTYLSRPDSLSARELADEIGAPSPAMVRQWVARDADGALKRRPGAAYARGIERATRGLVRRWDTRPEDWHLIWPELIDTPGAPPVPAPAPAVAQEAA